VTLAITVHDIAMHCGKQKKGKTAGPDGIAMEAFIYGGICLHILLSLLFNCYVKSGYLPKPFMQSLIIPLVKSKSGDLTDVNNYRAIALSTAVSKLFEMLLLTITLVNLLLICTSLASNQITRLGCVLI